MMAEARRRQADACHPRLPQPYQRAPSASTELRSPAAMALEDALRPQAALELQSPSQARNARAELRAPEQEERAALRRRDVGWEASARATAPLLRELRAQAAQALREVWRMQFGRRLQGR